MMMFIGTETLVTQLVNGSIGIHGGGETHLVSHFSAMDERDADDARQSNLLFLTAHEA